MPTIAPFHAKRLHLRIRHVAEEVRDWTVADSHESQHGTAETLGELADATRDLEFAALVVIGRYLDREYDGPPGPQDEMGGNGMPDAINELAETLAASHAPWDMDAVFERALMAYRGDV